MNAAKPHDPVKQNSSEPTPAQRPQSRTKSNKRNPTQNTEERREHKPGFPTQNTKENRRIKAEQNRTRPKRI
jgi:hypothetical protein